MDLPTTETTNPVSTPATSSKEKSSAGTLITLLIIVVIIVIGAFYTWGQRVAEDRELPPTELPE